jgi:hypothetical protein
MSNCCSISIFSSSIGSGLEQCKKWVQSDRACQAVILVALAALAIVAAYYLFTIQPSSEIAGFVSGVQVSLLAASLIGGAIYKIGQAYQEIERQHS